MIDTDKYEGHTMTNLVFDEDSPNARLIADAALLLAEVKRLREENEMLREGIERAIYDFSIANENLNQYLKELIE